MLYHENLAGMAVKERKDWVDFVMKKINPKPFFRIGEFPTFSSFVNHMQLEDAGTKINPFTVRSIVANNAIWHYIALSYGNLPEKNVELTLVGQDKKLMQIVKKMESKSGIVAPVGYDLLYKFDSIFMCWFTEAFFAASRALILAKPTEFGNSLIISAIGKKVFGSNFSDFLESDPVLNTKFMERRLKSTGGLTGQEWKIENSIQHFVENDYQELFNRSSRIKALKGHYTRNVHVLLSGNVDFSLSFSESGKFENIIDIGFLEYLKELDPSLPPSQKLIRQVNIVVEENYLKPKDKSGTAFAEKLKRQREAHAKAHESLMTVRCPRPEKKIHRTPELAWMFIEENHPTDKFMDVYQCSCGAWHIGHTSKKITRPIFHQLAKEGTVS